MVNEELLVGLRNALERGEDIETAIKTLTISGYDRFEVNEAAKIIIKDIAEAQKQQDSGVPQYQVAQREKSFFSFSKKPKVPKSAVQSPASKAEDDLKLPPMPELKKKASRKKLILVVLLVLLLAAAGVIAYFLLKKS